jgi:hypothetical protein
MIATDWYFQQGDGDSDLGDISEGIATFILAQVLSSDTSAPQQMIVQFIGVNSLRLLFALATAVVVPPSPCLSSFESCISFAQCCSKLVSYIFHDFQGGSCYLDLCLLCFDLTTCHFLLCNWGVPLDRDHHVESDTSMPRRAIETLVELFVDISNWMTSSSAELEPVNGRPTGLEVRVTAKYYQYLVREPTSARCQ